MFNKTLQLERPYKTKHLCHIEVQYNHDNSNLEGDKEIVRVNEG